jgi:3-hydroxyacyl-[acyl-carrier-protein] dehydratase
MRHIYFDRVVELERGKRVTGIKSVAFSEDVFEHHFPGNPIYPGIYIVEGIAQAAGYLLHETTDRRRVALLASIDRARFFTFARPGDHLRYDATIQALDENAARVGGEARVGERRLAALQLTFRMLRLEQLVRPPHRQHWESMYAQWRAEFPDQEEP